MPVTRSQIVEEARTWLGTPFHHQACVKGRGVDCAGLAKGIALELGILTPAQAETIPRNYKEYPDTVVMRHTLETHMVRVWPVKIGDWLWMAAMGEQPTHLVMIASETSVIHAHSESGFVVEHKARPAHMRTAKGAYAYRGIVDG